MQVTKGVNIDCAASLYAVLLPSSYNDAWGPTAPSQRSQMLSFSFDRVRSRFSRAVPARKNMFMVGSASSHDGHFIFNDFPIPMLGHPNSRVGQCTQKSRTSSYKVHTSSDGILIKLCIDHIHKISNHEYLFRCL